MSHESLEQQIVEALRRAPGPEPGAALDAAILARARAAVTPTPRRSPGTRWLSLAAGVLVIVGGGLALRIWQQVERMPGPLDAPPAATAPAPPEAASTSSAAKADLGLSVPETTLRKEAAPAELSDRLSEDAPAAGSAEARIDASLGQLRADAETPVQAPAPAQTENQEAMKSAPAALALPARRDAADEQRERAVIADDTRRSQEIVASGMATPPASAADTAPAAVPAEPLAAPKPVAAAASAPSPPPPAEPAPAAPAPFPGLSGAGAERQSSPEARAQALQPAPADLSERYARIRALLAAQQSAAALDELRALQREYPALPLPQDLQAALEQLESGS